MARFDYLVNQHLAVATRFGDEVMVRCIFHDDSKASMQFNVASGLFVCFACHAKGSVRKIQKQLGLRQSDGEFDVAELRARLNVLKNPEPTNDILPVLDESYLTRYRFPTDYWAERGISDRTANLFDLGCDPLDEYVTIPIRDIRGNLLGVIRRTLDPRAEIRYLYPKGFKRASNLFASWLVEADDDCDHVVLVEGSLDAVKVWQAGYPAMAVYGSSISPQQVRVLRRLGIGQVTLMFDNDPAGKKCTKSALGWHVTRRGNRDAYEYRPETNLTRDFLVSVVRYPRRSPKDPGAMTSTQIADALDNAVRTT